MRPKGRLSYRVRLWELQPYLEWRRIGALKRNLCQLHLFVQGITCSSTHLSRRLMRSLGCGPRQTPRRPDNVSRFSTTCTAQTSATLNIYVVEKGGDVTKQIPDWSRSGDHDDKWVDCWGPLPRRRWIIKWSLRGTVGSSSLADIAIDDFRIVDGKLYDTR